MLPAPQAPRVTTSAPPVAVVRGTGVQATARDVVLTKAASEDQTWVPPLETVRFAEPAEQRTVTP